MSLLTYAVKSSGVIALEHLLDVALLEFRADEQMERGDELIFFTDGATEATNSYGEDFGKGRLLKSIFRNADRPLTTQVNCIVSDILTFTGNAPQKDDITIIILKKK